jgi:prepilin-type N-terminal cleavage/methylation domain-containing protein
MRRKRAFTLVELLIVIGIIGVLSSILIPTVAGVRRKQRRKETALFVNRLKLALEQYAADFGDFPPSNPKLVGLPSNNVNDGNESLVRCLSTKKKSGPYFEFPEELLKNLDGDKLTSGNPTDSYITTRDLFEVVDPYGNPYIYIHNADYDKTFKYQVGDEEVGSVKVTGTKSKKTGQFHGFKSFQLWSLGSHGNDVAGDEEDGEMTSWSDGKE